MVWVPKEEKKILLSESNVLIEIIKTIGYEVSVDLMECTLII